MYTSSIFSAELGGVANDSFIQSGQIGASHLKNSQVRLKSIDTMNSKTFQLDGVKVASPLSPSREILVAPNDNVGTT